MWLKASERLTSFPARATGGGGLDSKPLRVLHVITLSQWGGAQQVCYDLVTRLDRSKFVCEVSCSPKGELVERLTRKGVVVHEVPFRRGVAPVNDLKVLVALVRLIRRGRYDIVHCHSTKAGALGRIAAWLARTPYIYFTVHGWGFYNEAEYGYMRPLLVCLERLLARITTSIVCVSEHDRSEGLARRIAPPGKFLVIHNGAANESEERTFELRRLVGALESDIVVGMVARLAYQKDPLTYLAAARRVVAEAANVKFVLIGDGPLRPSCESYIRANGLTDKVFILGFRADVRRLLPDLDIFVLSSKFEGLPITVIEAMLAGLPVVATDVGGVGELVRDGQNGFLVPAGSADGLADRVVRLARDATLRSTMGELGRKIARSRFDGAGMVRAYEELYKRAGSQDSGWAARSVSSDAGSGSRGGCTTSHGALQKVAEPTAAAVAEVVRSVGAPRASAYALSGAKRLFDAFLAAVGFVFSLPLWLVIGTAILIEDGRPVFYAQQRVGRDGRVFALLKFRSMTKDAEKATGPVLSSANDPRVTRVGRVLRATAMDELPQLLNILLGHMSFVGPRPERPELVARILESCPAFAQRHLIRPGLTGPAQVYGHYDLSPAEKLAYDLEYIRKASLWWDLCLILRSFWITLRGRWQERHSHVDLATHTSRVLGGP
jgi:lipopolysaccharide/colanic/teichoic acid biosynthesis glycosyltransferase/glycosyltransferase involved in cell wall biosynthesis